MLATIMAALAAIPEIVKVIGELVSEVKQLRQDSIDKSLEGIRNDVREILSKIQNAQTNADRTKLAAELNALLGK